MTDPTDSGDAPRLAGYVATWRSACADFVALAREIPEEQWELPTDLDGWSVIDNVAHTAHLEAVLAGAPEETIEVPTSAHIKGGTGWYTEQGVLARRGRTMAQLADEIEQSVALRGKALDENPPTDGAAAPPKTPGDIGWSTEILLRNRPLDIWMHEQDIRRAIRKPGGLGSLAAQHTVRLLATSLPLVVGKRVAPPAGTVVVVDVPEAGLTAGVIAGDDGRAKPTPDTANPTVRITLDAESWIILGGGRRTPDRVSARIEGDQELGRQVLNCLAVTP
jgi:uncharacterized protein (TIGR03083 family)